MNEENNELDYSKLTERQKRFIDYYIETANATESAKLAGYSEKTAKQIGCENLAKLYPYIKEKIENKENERIAKQDEVLEYFTKVMRGELKDQFDLDASLQERTRCAENLCKRYGLFIDRKQVEGKDGNVIRVTLTDD